MRLLLLALLSFSVEAQTDCTVFINRVLEKNASFPSPPPPSFQQMTSLSELLVAFTQGLEPDLGNPDQRMAFRVYRKLRFGNPEANLDKWKLSENCKSFKKIPRTQG